MKNLWHATRPYRGSHLQVEWPTSWAWRATAAGPPPCFDVGEWHGGIVIIYPPWNSQRPLKSMVGRLLSFWECLKLETNQLSLVGFFPVFTRFYTSQVVVWDFFHQQYVSFREGSRPLVAGSRPLVGELAHPLQDRWSRAFQCRKQGTWEVCWCIMLNLSRHVYHQNLFLKKYFLL